MQNIMVHGYRLTPQQKRLWQLQQGENASPQSAQCAVVLDGPLNVQTLRSAIEMTVKRHEILRTSFARLPEMTLPLQVIDDECRVQWHEPVDFSGLETEQEEQVETLLGRLRAEDGPRLQAQLLKLDVHRHMLLVSLPILCADAVGLQNLVGEIGSCYTACLNDEPLENGHVQYADLSEILNELLEAEDTAAGRDYWRRQQLAEGVRLPLEERSVGRGAFQPQVHRERIDAGVVERLKAIATENETTTSAVLLACWQVLLARLSQQKRIVVGTAYDGRTYEGLGECIGLLTKYLPLTIELDGGMRFDEVLKEVADKPRVLYEWQEYFCWDHFAATDDGAGAPFFPYCFDYEEHAGKHSSDRLTFSIDRKYVYTERFKVQLSCVASGDSLEVQWHYDPRYYTPTTIEELAAQYRTLLESVSVQPQAAIARLNILPAEQRDWLLVEVNQTAAPYPDQASIQQLFAEQVMRTPLATAVIHGAEEVSYRELNERANQLAHQLIALGVGPEVRVGLMMERSVELVVGLLGILKTGGAYVPLDPEYPADRLRWMIEDSQVPVLVTQQRLLERIPEHSAQVVCIDEECGEHSRENPIVESGADNLAYVIYTSGSTGRPKGVMIAHRSVVNRLVWAQSVYPLSETDRVLQLASPSFDFSVWECFAPLLFGARLVLMPTQDASHIVSAIVDHEITVVHFVPSLLQSLVKELEQCRSLRLVLCGGEALSIDLQNRFFDCSNAELYNQYGPTEACIDASYFRCRRELVSGSVPIGQPIANTRLYVLDDELQLVPAGTPGELYIGGIGLARGYLNRAELTAERFIPDPFSGEAGGRLYRTGDLARCLLTGEVEYLGRTDEQVKIRGFRIELGEIEAVLSAHEAVREAVVLAREEQSGDKRLVAYVVAQSEVNWREVREHLRARVPEYMVPSAVVLLSEMPLTGNGKLDRKALPAPEDVEGAGESYVAPRTAIEELLCGIWSEVLGVDQIGVEWNFFELGGHSLLATQVVSRVREAFGVEMALRTVFERPTVGELAVAIEEQLRGGERAERGKIERVARDGKAPLSFAQQRLWFIDQLEPGSAVYNLPVGVRMTGELDVKALERTLSEMVRRHEVLRTTFTSVDGEPVQVIGEAYEITLPIIDLHEMAEAEREAEALRLAAEEAQRPFDLSRGPLLRASLLRLGEREHVVLLTMHHIISDGWSMSVLVKEVGALYEAYTRGAESPLAELPIQYADYAAWQRGWLQGEVLERQLSYWREQLKGAPPVLELPIDRARSSAHIPIGASHEFVLSSELVSSMKELGRQEDVTLFMVLLAGLQVLLHCHTGQDDIIVGSNIANRNRKETEELIGFFVNLLVLRTKLSRDTAFRELLRQVREVTLGAYAHQDVPFEKLIEELQPERALSRTPVVQVVCNFGVAQQSGLTLTGLELGALDADAPVAKFDLTLDLRSAADQVYGTWLYDQTMFDAARIQRMTRHLQEALENAVVNPEIKMSDLTNMLDEADRRQQMVEQKEFKEMRRRKLREMKTAFQNV
jgi:amino acid adenylation domain-containing protein